MIVFVGAAVPGPTTRRRQITNTDMIAAVHDARMRTLHPRLGTGGRLRYVRCEARPRAFPDSTRLPAPGAVARPAPVHARVGALGSRGESGSPQPGCESESAS